MVHILWRSFSGADVQFVEPIWSSLKKKFISLLRAAAVAERLKRHIYVPGSNTWLLSTVKRLLLPSSTAVYREIRKVVGSEVKR